MLRKIITLDVKVLILCFLEVHEYTREIVGKMRVKLGDSEIFCNYKAL